MTSSKLRLIDTGRLPYLLSLPAGDPPASGVWPLLCFLHGYDEGAPMPIEQALTRHGPLAATAAPRAASQLIVIAPQLPIRGDRWLQQADAVEQIVQQVHAAHQGDSRRTYLTGFSFGGNGVFDLALHQRDLWTALWPVDPTRLPQQDPRRPIWFSSGQISRHAAEAFIERLRLQPPGIAESQERLYVDEGQDHVGTARRAYGDDRIYRWLLAQSR